SSDICKLREGWDGDDGESSIVAGDADSCDGYGLPGGKTVGSRSRNGYEKTILGRASRTSGDRNGSRLRGANRARRNRNGHVFIDHGWPGARSALADAVEIGVVVLTRQVV